jgi:Holliday junction resolvase RusA-like endonuclease
VRVTRGGRYFDAAYEAKKRLLISGLLEAKKSPYIWTGRVVLNVRFIFGHPTRRGAHTMRPDKDNCEKALKDAMKRAGYFKDDSQVYKSTMVKLWGARDEIQISIFRKNEKPEAVKKTTVGRRAKIAR